MKEELKNKNVDSTIEDIFKFYKFDGYTLNGFKKFANDLSIGEYGAIEFKPKVINSDFLEWAMYLCSGGNSMRTVDEVSFEDGIFSVWWD